MADKIVVCAGTKRGLFLLEAGLNRSSWKVSGPHLKGWQIFHAVIDTRATPRVHAAAVSNTFAATTVSGPLSDLKLEAAKKPPVPPKLLPAQWKFIKQWNLPAEPRIWHIEPGRPSEKGVLYAGVAPAALFRSEDDGKTWAEVKGLSKHPSRKKWMPGAGGLALHSIQLDPRDSNRMYVGISAAGIFRTDNGGKSWKPVNKGITNFEGGVLKEGGVGTCVHKVLLHPGKPGRLFQQNHVGVYRTDDYGDSWDRIDKGLPYEFGFGLALNPADAETCYVTPLEPQGGTYRATAGKLRVYKFHGSNSSPAWDELGNGLPSEDAYLSVLREGMANDSLQPVGVYVGTGTGQIYHSADAGSSWRAIATTLPPILSISAAVV
jgi:photosystem II stability/assembly factor-like uncharacterized protein